MTNTTSKRFYLPELKHFESGDIVPLPDDQSRHAINTLRLKSGGLIEAFDGRGMTADAELIEITKKQCKIKLKTVKHTPPDTHQIIVASAVPKGARVDMMVEKMSELGAHVWIPLNTTHASVQPRGAKLDRLRKICIESAKQNRRSHLMEIKELTDFKHLLENIPQQSRVLFCDVPLASSRNTLETASLFHPMPLPKEDQNPNKNTLVLIGPEGGWSDEERVIAHNTARVWTFSPHILRIETAVISATAILAASLHDTHTL